MILLVLSVTLVLAADADGRVYNGQFSVEMERFLGCFVLISFWIYHSVLGKRHPCLSSASKDVLQQDGTMHSTARRHE